MTTGSPITPAGLADEVLRRLVGSGARLTRSRRAVVEVLVAAERPLSVVEIVQRRTVPTSTAYRILVDLEARGLVDRIAGTDEAGRYELAQSITGRHHHLMCTDCGTVVDIDLPQELEDMVADRARTADPGLDLALERLDLVGRCTACR